MQQHNTFIMFIANQNKTFPQSHLLLVEVFKQLSVLLSHWIDALAPLCSTITGTFKFLLQFFFKQTKLAQQIIILKIADWSCSLWKTHTLSWEWILKNKEWNWDVLQMANFNLTYKCPNKSNKYQLLILLPNHVVL